MQMDSQESSLREQALAERRLASVEGPEATRLVFTPDVSLHGWKSDSVSPSMLLDDTAPLSAGMRV
jgi:hypothetical protein